MGNLVIQIASLAAAMEERFALVDVSAGRGSERARKNIFNINAHIYKGFNKWIKFMCT